MLTKFEACPIPPEKVWTMSRSLLQRFNTSAPQRRIASRKCGISEPFQDHVPSQKVTRNPPIPKMCLRSPCIKLPTPSPPSTTHHSISPSPSPSSPSPLSLLILKNAPIANLPNVPQNFLPTTSPLILANNLVVASLTAPHG